MSPLADGCYNLKLHVNLHFLGSSVELTDNSWEDKIQTCHVWWPYDPQAFLSKKAHHGPHQNGFLHRTHR